MRHTPHTTPRSAAPISTPTYSKPQPIAKQKLQSMAEEIALQESHADISIKKLDEAITTENNAELERELCNNYRLKAIEELIRQAYSDLRAASYPVPDERTIDGDLRYAKPVSSALPQPHSAPTPSKITPAILSAVAQQLHHRLLNIQINGKSFIEASGKEARDWIIERRNEVGNMLLEVRYIAQLAEKVEDSQKLKEKYSIEKVRQLAAKFAQTKG